MNFNYFGVETSCSRNLTNEVRSQADNAAKISGYLKDIIWGNKYLTVLYLCLQKRQRQEPTPQQLRE